MKNIRLALIGMLILNGTAYAFAVGTPGFLAPPPAAHRVEKPLKFSAGRFVGQPKRTVRREDPLEALLQDYRRLQAVRTSS